MSDLISRQEAIDFIDAGHLCNPNEPRWSDNEIVNFLKSRPSAQRDGTDTNVGGTIYRQAAIDVMCGACSDWCDEGVCKKASAIQKLPSAQQWIPCSERLPEYGIPVLWSNEHGSVFISAITAMTDHSWAVGKRHRQSKVIAWQPLPEPYKGGEINV